MWNVIMTMSVCVSLCLLPSRCAGASEGEANPSWLAIAPKIGTLGIGGDVVLGLAPTLNARVGANFLGLNMHRTMSDIDYAVELDYLSYSALLDWHAFDGSFRVSAGALFNQNRATLNSTPSMSQDIGGIEYTPSEIGTLTADLRYEHKVAPYVGIGWGNAFKNGRIGLSLDLGVAFTGAPKAALSATGAMASDPSFQQSLAQEQRDVQDSVDPFEYYPVIALSLFIRF